MKEPHFELYRDKREGWRWRVLARNGKIVADSAEGYKRRADVMRSISLVMGTIEVRDPNGNVIVEDKL